MSTIQPLSVSRHNGLRWHRSPDYRFAADRNFISLAAAEIGQAALSLPLALLMRDGRWSLCAILGLFPGQNLYVGPDGQWIASYVPANLRGYPFHFGRTETGDGVLCIDEGSGLLGVEGEPLFADTGELNPLVAQVWSFLSTIAASELALGTACEELARAGVIEPWPISLQTAEGSKEVTGLNRISEAALTALDDQAFVQLRRSNALPVAYAQILSMGNLSDLGKLAEAHAMATAQRQANERARAERPPLINLPDDSTIDWDWSKIGR